MRRPECQFPGREREARAIGKKAVRQDGRTAGRQYESRGLHSKREAQLHLRATHLSTQGRTCNVRTGFLGI
jgi:hypothetical protein